MHECTNTRLAKKERKRAGDHCVLSAICLLAGYARSQLTITLSVRKAWQIGKTGQTISNLVGMLLFIFHSE